VSVHPSAIIHPKTKLAEGVEVGAYSVIGKDVQIGRGTWIGPHVVINGPTRIGVENRIFQFSSIGEIPQDKKFSSEETLLVIGDRNTIREYVTINRGTQQGGGATTIGNDNWLMAYIHVAHDCHIGNSTIFSNGASLAGHASVDDFAVLGGFTLVHQFCSIGKHAFCGMGSAVGKDVPPYVMVSGSPAQTYGVNIEGLKRHGFSKDRIQRVREIYKTIYRSGLSLEEAKQKLAQASESDEDIVETLTFLQKSSRSIIR
jgi:UDP-N-acetylglucosamine acyltransferase